MNRDGRRLTGWHGEHAASHRVGRVGDVDEPDHAAGAVAVDQRHAVFGRGNDLGRGLLRVGRVFRHHEGRDAVEVHVLRHGGSRAKRKDRGQRKHRTDHVGSLLSDNRGGRGQSCRAARRDPPRLHDSDVTRDAGTCGKPVVTELSHSRPRPVRQPSKKTFEGDPNAVSDTQPFHTRRDALIAGALYAAARPGGAPPRDKRGQQRPRHAARRTRDRVALR
jgi:hypothetical protein